MTASETRGSPLSPMMSFARRSPSIESRPAGKGVVRAEEEFVGDVVLLSGDQHRVELPRPVVECRDICVDVRVLPDHDQAFFTEWMSDVREDHSQFRIGDRDLIEKPWTA